MSKTLDQIYAEDLRLSLLRALNDMTGYSANESMLVSAVAVYGITASRDRVRTELAWLKEQGCVALEDVGLYVARLTPRGVDVAEGCATVPGIKRPAPKSC